MPRTDSNTRQKRIELVCVCLERHPNGLTEREVADMLGFEQRTVNNYLHELEIQGKAYKEEHSPLWCALPYRRTRLRRLDLSPEEAMTLYLATRLLVKQHDKRNESAETALAKLADALTGDAEVGHEIYQAAQELAHRPGDVGYSRVFRTIMQSYIYRRKVAITYHPLRGKSFQTVFAPYLLEPSAIGYATYAIGHSSVVSDLRILKLQRIEQATLTRDDYVVPSEFAGLAYLRSAWSIIPGEELIAVKLRFSHRVARRVRETRWHPSQKVFDDPDNPGGCIWTAQIGDLTDFVPWVRSWGADANVLAPEELRESLVAEVREMANLYHVVNARPDPQLARVLRCWGKTGHEPEYFHPALYHMLDVGHVALALLQSPASPRWRNVLATALGTEPETLMNWLPYVIAMHDIAKISAAFQSQRDDQRARLEQEHFSFSPWRRSLNSHHSLTGLTVIEHELSTLPLSENLRRIWGDAVGGHHGQFHARQEIKTIRSRLQDYEPSLWRELRAATERVLRQQFLDRSLARCCAPPNVAVALMALTGFTILCDWLGSDERFFSPHPDLSLAAYLPKSRRLARRAVRRARFYQSVQSQAATPFISLFPDKQPPRPLQAAVDAIPRELCAEPCLAIIEAPTGEGKTEAALTLAHRLAGLGGSDELYYALPTTATSNQMFGRAQKYLYENLKLSTQVELIHGQAFLVRDDLQIAPLDGGDESDRAAMVEWFTSKKRAVLAPFGVGTIDQAELCALNVKHNALRLVGLAGKVLILDEVHAYDTYMTTIVERLLQWLSALGTSVIILSATLPQRQRAQLARAYGAEIDAPSDQLQAYPSMWLLRPGHPPYHAHPPAHQPDRRLSVRRLHIGDDAPEEKARWLVDAVADGGCACWICNTVARAQQVFDALRETAAPDTDLTLLHARFPLEERQAIEVQLASKYGPDGDRPARGIVVGTQVLEQSLDLDFDVMVSDLAPIDLLLQRAGRLQRHENLRPAAYAAGPTLWINAALDTERRLTLDVDGVIYDEFLLRQTWAILRGRQVIYLPKDYRDLVEAVYSADAPSPASELAAAWDALQRKQSDAQKEADQRLVPGPDAGRSLCRRIARITFEEDETGASWFVARTRLGRESVNLIPLERQGETGRLYPADETVRLDRRASGEMQLRLLRRQVRVSRPEIVRAVKEMENLPPLFGRSPRLTLWAITSPERLLPALVNPWTRRISVEQGYAGGHARSSPGTCDRQRERRK
jgi:CRISPR-associated endonuclease/helicase Cas3